MGKILEDAGFLKKDDSGQLKLTDSTVIKFLEVRKSILDSGSAGLPFPCINVDASMRAAVIDIQFSDRERYPDFFKKWVDNILFNTLLALNFDGNIALPIYCPMALGAKLLPDMNLPKLPFPMLLGMLALPPGLPTPLVMLGLDPLEAFEVLLKVPDIIKLPDLPPGFALPSPIVPGIPALGFEPLQFSLLGKFIDLQLQLPKAFLGLFNKALSLDFLIKFSGDPLSLFTAACGAINDAAGPPPANNLTSATVNSAAITVMAAEALGFAVLGSIIGSSKDGIIGHMGAAQKYRRGEPPVIPAPPRKPIPEYTGTFAPPEPTLDTPLLDKHQLNGGELVESVYVPPPLPPDFPPEKVKPPPEITISYVACDAPPGTQASGSVSTAAQEIAAGTPLRKAVIEVVHDLMGEFNPTKSWAKGQKGGAFERMAPGWEAHPKGATSCPTLPQYVGAQVARKLLGSNHPKQGVIGLSGNGTWSLFPHNYILGAWVWADSLDKRPKPGDMFLFVGDAGPSGSYDDYSTAILHIGISMDASRGLVDPAGNPVWGTADAGGGQSPNQTVGYTARRVRSYKNYFILGNIPVPPVEKPKGKPPNPPPKKEPPPVEGTQGFPTKRILGWVDLDKLYPHFDRIHDPNLKYRSLLSPSWYNDKGKEKHRWNGAMHGPHLGKVVSRVRERQMYGLENLLLP